MDRIHLLRLPTHSRTPPTVGSLKSSCSILASQWDVLHTPVSVLMYYRILATVSTLSLVIIAMFCLWIFANITSLAREIERSVASYKQQTTKVTPQAFIPKEESAPMPKDIIWNAPEAAKEEARQRLRGVQVDPRATITPVPNSGPKTNPNQIFPGFERR